MTRIYFVRHCEAEGNLKRILQGSINLDITETGAKQLECLSTRFDNISLDKIYSSPLIRTQKTAHSFADRKNAEVEIHSGLRELDCGIFEGMPFEELFGKYPEFQQMWLLAPEKLDPEGGEPMAQAYERIWESVVDIVRKNPNKTVAAATHGGVMGCLMCRLKFGDITRLKDTPWMDNTAVTLIEFDESGKARIIFENDTSHLPDSLMPKKSRISDFASKGDKK